jgi:hypothetical protein
VLDAPAGPRGAQQPVGLRQVERGGVDHRRQRGPCAGAST